MAGTLFPFEFIVEGIPLSLGASSRSRESWKQKVHDAGLRKREQVYELGFLDSRPVAVTIYYFSNAAVEGDIDNIGKPILDAMIGVAYPDDRFIERIVIQRFEPSYAPVLVDPSDVLASVLEKTFPLVYIRVDADLAWRSIK